MDLDFEESLPSYSNLVAPSRCRTGGYDSQERQSGHFSQFGHTASVEYDRPSSPPPPPPPLSAFEDHPVRRMSAPVANTNGSAQGNGKGRPSFPFLKKNSRKEPSALNRSPRSPSSNSPSPVPTPSNASDDINNGNGKSFHDRTGLQGVQQRLHEDDDSGEEGDDIFLSGTGYWQADDMKSNLKTSTMRASHGKGISDPLDSSTINIGGEQWQQQRAEGQEELDEFELIERQLENSSLANTFGAVNKSLANSTHFHSSQANSAAQSRPEAVKPKVDDWSDAYEHDSFAKTKNNQREGTQPQHSSHSYKTDLHDYHERANADKDSEEEQYAEDFSGSDEEDVHFRANEHNSSNRISTQGSTVRLSASDYIHSTSPPRRNHHQQEQEQEQDFEERSSKPSARPSYSKHWDGRSDSPSEDHADIYEDTRAEEAKIHTAAPAMRTTESPSWGRSTQPVRHSFSENEGAGSEQDDSRGGFGSTSRAAEGAKMARMSNSALRKISSRTAALHGQGQTPVSRLERPTLADDTQRNGDRNAFSDPEDEETAPQEVIYTRPTPVRRASGPAATVGVGAGAGRGAAAKPRSSSTGGRLRPGAMSAAGTAPGNVGDLSEKAQALEQELQTYRNENAQLKKIRRQQETTLAEVVHQKEELMRWVAEEKAKTLKWCEEQTQAATKERNAAAKLARDSRQKALSGTMPIRKEKAEMEALQATIEKMKIDHEAAAKKWKLAEARLYSLIKEHTAHIESSEKQLLAVEQEKLLLLEYIGEQGLRLPKQLRGSLQRAPLYRTSPDAHSGASKGLPGSSSVAQDVLRGKSPGNRSKYPSDRGYAEEVDVEFADATTTVHSASTVRASSATGVSSSSMGRSATPIARSNAKLAATYQPGEMLNRQSSNLKAGLGATSAVRAGSSTGSRVADMIGSSANAGASWARSSRSSTGSAGRYDHADAEDNSDVYKSADLGSLLRRSHSEESNKLGPSGSAKSATKATSSCGPPDVPTSASSSSLQPKSPSYAPATSFKSNVPATLQQGATVNLAATSAAGGNSRTEETLPDGKKLIKYKNGTQKEIDEAGNSLVRFLNGDTKSVNATNGVVIYYYAQADTTHTTFKDGLEVYEFPNKQVEMHFPDGIKEIIFPDSTRKVINPDGLQESHFPDGVILREHADGRREVLSAKDV